MKLELKKQGFKSECGQVVYAGYLLGVFQGYFHKVKAYELTPKGEKFKGYSNQLFHRGKLSWDEWKTLQH